MRELGPLRSALLACRRSLMGADSVRQRPGFPSSYDLVT
ncbi:Protein of unknown function [Propionibacterium freudenreichii]|uniref:Uncharacterized protein n=1 Tax=Propionibacterium freudenreichii subsp. freudenreichii TaxID=66712 RepID=A0A068VV62_PROFF|nr:Protein of unknown function [Propionibacterium freudenreichii subsp. freudenreichii]CEG88278.1 Protein of unknown function [Propionibacterium freudenreichii]CEG94563.1 Protein of unknown function [Propionibacterium freudenreichii]CEH00496.1 Protein of unknown function [Propionibacterium freudenreichii]CEH01911.1 Protein of unknown function [Propionibacterium freudenreichii]